MTEKKLIIGIATYKRPEGLTALLNSILEDKSSASSSIVVVDNDPDGGAKTVAGLFEHMNVTYLHQPTPGIAAVRNCALDFAVDQHADALIFVDDDEHVSSGWAGRLSDAQEHWDADVVCGPVVPVLEDDAPGWVRWGRFFERESGVTGGNVRWPATNNVLIRLTSPGLAEGIRFREEFSMTGGSDTDFFYNLRELGAKFVWCEEATVWESVPPERATLQWLWRRGRRLGNVSARMMSRRHSRPYVAAVASARIAASIPMALFALVSRRHSLGNAAMQLPKGIGMLQALKGNLIIEYKRPARQI